MNKMLGIGESQGLQAIEETLSRDVLASEKAGSLVLSLEHREFETADSPEMQGFRERIRRNLASAKEAL